MKFNSKKIFVLGDVQCRDFSHDDNMTIVRYHAGGFSGQRFDKNNASVARLVKGKRSASKFRGGHRFWRAANFVPGSATSSSSPRVPFW